MMLQFFLFSSAYPVLCKFFQIFGVCFGRFDKLNFSVYNYNIFLPTIFIPAFYFRRKGYINFVPSLSVVHLSVRTCQRYIMRFAICTAVFSEVRVRLGLVQYGVMGLKWACGVNLKRITPSICNGHGPLETSERRSCKNGRLSVRPYIRNVSLKMYLLLNCLRPKQLQTL